MLVILTPRAYHGAIPVVSVLTLYYASMFFAKQPQLVYARKTYLLSVLTLVTLAMTVLCTLAGVRAFGLVGAALGILLAGLASVALYNVMARRYYRIEWEAGKLALMAAVLAAGSALAILMARTGLPYGARLAVKLGAVGAYAALGSRFDILTAHNFQIAWSVLARKPKAA